MAKSPAFQFYANDFIADTQDWSIEEIGIYIRLLCYQWNNGAIPDDKKRIARISGCDLDAIEKAWVILDLKFIKHSEGLKNLRLEQTREEQIKFREKQSLNGSKGGRPLKNKTQTKPKQNPNDNPNDNPEESSSTSSSNKDNNTPDKSGSIDYQKFIDVFNSFAGRSFKVTEKVKSSLKSRLKDYSKEQIVKAIELAHKDQFHIESKFKHLTPEFILRPDKLEKFLNLSVQTIKPFHLQRPLN